MQGLSHVHVSIIFIPIVVDLWNLSIKLVDYLVETKLKRQACVSTISLTRDTLGERMRLSRIRFCRVEQRKTESAHQDEDHFGVCEFGFEVQMLKEIFFMYNIVLEKQVLMFNYF